MILLPRGQPLTPSLHAVCCALPQKANQGALYSPAWPGVLPGSFPWELGKMAAVGWG